MFRNKEEMFICMLSIKYIVSTNDQQIHIHTGRRILAHNFLSINKPIVILQLGNLKDIFLHFAIHTTKQKRL